MQTTTVHETAQQVKSPFQLLAAYTENDRDKFFGREAETRLLYQLVQEANAVLVYGESGTGKTSLVQCGLINETRHFNWTSITIRRIEDINRSLFERLAAHADESYRDATAVPGVIDLLQEVFLHNFQPIMLIFDQFEELFIFGKEAERTIFIQHVEEIFKLRIPWKMVFVMREEFIARLTEFEDRLPHLFKKRMRIELMDKPKCREVIIRSCERFGITLLPLRAVDSVETDTPEKIIEAVSNADGLVHPPYLQVFLDTLWKEAQQGAAPVTINEAVVKKVGSIGNVLKAFLEEKVQEQQILSKVDVWKFLKLFVAESGTSRKKVLLGEYTAIPPEKLKKLVAYLAGWKILSEYAEDSFELAHESLVPIIQNIKLTEIRTLLISPTIKGNPYKGLQSFDARDHDRFYGRREAIQAVYDKVQKQNLVVVVGNSGAGKSSLIKAGLLPILENEGYKVLSIVRAGEQPLRSVEEALLETKQATHKYFLLLIDQYEELITRITEKGTRQAVYEKIYRLLEGQQNGHHAYTLKIIITVRADFEPQFRMEAPLAGYWKAGKYLIPPFSRDEIREVIEEPAYQAGLEFSPPSLVDTIAEEVYSSQSTGLLPLMSFTLSELYKAYEESGRNDKLLTEEDYNRLGGVIGGLQNRADYVYQALREEHPQNYKTYQDVMQNILLRMVYLSTGELAGQRVLKEDLVFKEGKINAMGTEVLARLLQSHLIVSGEDNRHNVYYEPAHDVLVKTWGQIWEWIGQMGKEAFFLRNRLAQAVNDYYNTNKEAKLLWDHSPWLDSLTPVLPESQTGWLNEKEENFITASKEKAEEAFVKEEREREEKITLIQEKYTEQQEKSKLIEEKVAEQKITIRKEKKFRVAILVALVCAALLGGVAFWQYTLANQNYRLATKNLQTTLLQTHLIQNKNKLLEGAYDSINKLVEAKTALAEQEQRSAMEAMQSARVAKEQQLIALKLVKKLDTQVKETKAAQLLAEARRDSLREVAASERKARFVTDSVNKALALNNHVLDSINRALNIQKGQNVSQLLTLSKSLEQVDMAKAYRLAELAYGKDPANNDVTEQFTRISSAPAYYYTKRLEGSMQKYSPDGKQIMVYDSTRNTLSLLESSTYNPLGVITTNPHLLSVSFSPDGKYLLLAYRNDCEIRKVNNLADKNNFKLKENNISSAVYSRNNKILVYTEEGLYLWKSLFGNEMPLKSSTLKPGAKVVSAFFSEDDKRIICNTENGAVYIWDLTTDDKKVVVTKNVKFSFISPAGNYFLTYTPAEISLYNSLGAQIKIPDFSRYGQLVSATFSAEGKQVVLSFINSSGNQPMLQQMQQQKGEASYSRTEYFLLDLNDPRKDTTRLNGYFKSANQLTSYNGVLSRDNGIILDFEENNLVFDKQNGLLEILNIHDKQQRVVALNGEKSPLSVTVRDNGNFILTSSADNSIKIWTYDYPENLDKKKLLPELTPQDMKKYGVEM